MKLAKYLTACSMFSIVIGSGTPADAIVAVSDPNNLNGSPVVEDFEDTQTVSGVNFSSSSGVDIVSATDFTNGGTPSGNMGLSTNNFPDPITISFNSPVSSAGLFFGNDDTCCSSGFQANLDIFNGNTLLSTISSTANMNDFADQFIGFNTTGSETVTSMNIRYGNGSNVQLFTYIDDAQFATQSSTQPVPFETEGTMGLVAIGGFLGYRYFKKRKQALNQ